MNVRGPVAIGIIVVLALGSSVGRTAAEERVGKTVIVPSGEVVREDLNIAAAAIEVVGEVSGDLTVGAATVDVVGRVGGDVTVLAGGADLRGPVGGSVRVAGGIVNVFGTVERDVVVAAGSLKLVEGSTIAGNLVVLGGWVTLIDESAVRGDVVALGGVVTLESAIDGDARIGATRLTMTPGASVGGDLEVRGDRQPDIAASALVGGSETLGPWFGILPGPAWLWWGNAAAPRFFLLLGSGLLALALAPATFVSAADRLRWEPASAVLAGFATLLIGPVVVLMLVILIVGAPLAVVGLPCLIAATYMSGPVVGLTLRRVVLRRRVGQRGPADLLAMGLGLGVISIVRIVPVPFLPEAVALLTTIGGVGGIALTIARPFQTVLPIDPASFPGPWRPAHAAGTPRT